MKYSFWVFFLVLWAATATVQAETWSATPVTGDWNTGTNWDLSTVPNGTGASATFGTSSTNSVTLSAATTVGDIQFNGSSSYAIYNNGNPFVLAGTGLNNASGVAQTLVGTGGLFLFENNAQAVSMVLLNGAGATLRFQDTASAGNAAIGNSGLLSFTGTSTAGSAAIAVANGGTAAFSGSADGGQAQFAVASGGLLDISQSSAGGVTIGSLSGGGNVDLGSKNLTTGINGTSTSFSGAITGTGSLTKNGLGLMIITGTNTYSGGTTVLSGSIVVNGGTLGTGPVNNQAGLVFAQSSTAVSTVLNSGTLAFQDYASAAFSDLTNNGILAFNNLSTAYSSSIVNNGTLNFNGNSTASQALITSSGLLNFNNGSMAEAAAISVTGGALYFTGDSAIIEATAFNAVIDDGNLVQFNDYSTAGSSDIHVHNGAALNFSGNAKGGNGSVILDGGGTLNIAGGTAGSVTLGDVMALSGSFVQLGANNLGLGANNTSAFLYGVVSGTGTLSVIGTGSVVLAASNTYSGGTSLFGGTLWAGVSDSLGTGSVANLGGNLVAFGGSPITIAVGGNYNQGSGGTLTLGLGGTLPGQWDSMQVTGAATLSGNLSISPYLSYVPTLGDSYVILSAGSVSGNFTAEQSTITAYRFLPLYSATEVTIVAVQPSFANLGLSPNQKAVGAALDSIFLDSTQQALMLDLGTQQAATLPAAYDLISPAGLTPLFQMGFELAQDRGALAQSRLSDLWDSIDAQPPSSALWKTPGRAFAANMDANEERAMGTSDPERGRWGAFAQGLGSFGKVTGDGNGPGYQFSTGGVVAGMDYRISHDLVGGLLLGFAQSGTAQALDSVQVSGGQVGLYGGWRSGSLRLHGIADGGVNNYNTTRAAYTGTVTGTTRGMQYGLELGGEVDLGQDGWKAGPLASGRLTHVEVTAFNETGSASALSFPDQGQDQIIAGFGLQAAKAFQMGGISLEPSVKATWEHLFQGQLDQLNALMGGGRAAFMVEGPALGQDGFLISAGLKARLAKGLALQAQYRGSVGQTNYDAQGFSGGFSLDF